MFHAIANIDGCDRTVDVIAHSQKAGSQRTAAWEIADVLNRYDRSSPMAGEAEVKYLDGDFRVMRPGAFVRCAVTGTPIPLEELKYWSVDLQEAYLSPEVVLQRHFPAQVRR
jgi:hypothetical protein